MTWLNEVMSSMGVRVLTDLWTHWGVRRENRKSGSYADGPLDQGYRYDQGDLGWVGYMTLEEFYNRTPNIVAQS